LTKFGKKSTEPSSVHKELSYGEKIAKIGPVYPEIFDKIRQFFSPLGKLAGRAVYFTDVFSIFLKIFLMVDFLALVA